MLKLLYRRIGSFTSNPSSSAFLCCGDSQMQMKVKLKTVLKKVSDLYGAVMIFQTINVQKTLNCTIYTKFANFFDELLIQNPKPSAEGRKMIHAAVSGEKHSR